MNTQLKENINVFDDDQEIKSLDTLNYKEISVSQSFESKKYYNNTYSIVVAEKKSDYIRYDVSSDDTGLIIFSDYGISWDEVNERYSGFVTLNEIYKKLNLNILQGYPDLSSYIYREYGVLFNLPLA